MYPDRRTLLVGTLGAAAVAVVVLGPLDPLEWVRQWLAVARPADGSSGELVEAVRARRVRVADLESILARDPLLSGALAATGLGAGLLLGSVGAYLHQRTVLRRGDHGG